MRGAAAKKLAGRFPQAIFEEDELDERFWKVLERMAPSSSPRRGGGA
jgi:hypothetical protein